MSMGVTKKNKKEQQPYFFSTNKPGNIKHLVTVSNKFKILSEPQELMT